MAARPTRAAIMTSRPRSRPTTRGVLFMNSHVRFDDIPDGLSHTILLGESIWNESNVLSWASGTRATLRNTGSPLNRRASDDRHSMLV